MLKALAVGPPQGAPDGTREHIAFHSQQPGAADHGLRECPHSQETILLCYESIPSHQEGNAPLSLPRQRPIRGCSDTRWWGCDLIAADVPIHILRKESPSSSDADENCAEKASRIPPEVRLRPNASNRSQIPVDAFILAQAEPSGRLPPPYAQSRAALARHATPLRLFSYGLVKDTETEAYVRLVPCGIHSCATTPAV